MESLERQTGKRKQRLKRRKAFRLFLIVVVIGIAVGADSFAAITTLQVNHRITKFGLNNVGELVTQTGYFYCGKRNGRQRQTLGLEYTIDRQQACVQL